MNLVEAFNMSENKNTSCFVEIDEFIGSLRRQNLSSPIGSCWDKFYRLISDDFSFDPLPPKPLILAASSEAASIKHTRLKDQLIWSMENGRLEDAMSYLKGLSSVDWEHCPKENWNKSYY